MSRIARSSIFLIVFLASVPFATAQSLEGFWRSEGYGYVFEIRGSSLKAFDVTKTTCVFDFTAQRDRRAVVGWEATFTTKQGDAYFIRTGGSSDLAQDAHPAFEQIEVAPNPAPEDPPSSAFPERAVNWW